MTDIWDWKEKETWDHCWVQLYQGVWMITCRSKNFNNPLGFIYGMSLGKIFFIAGMYTPHWARRHGVARFLCDQLLLMFPTLLTQEGSDEGGKLFLESYGFRFDDKLQWIYQKLDSQSDSK